MSMRETVMAKHEHGAKRVSDEVLHTAFDFCEGYKQFLNEAKTEREAVTALVRRAQEAGFTPFDPAKAYAPGDRVYFNNWNKSAVFCVFGREPLTKGLRIGAAHIDSPRLDLKPNPVYEEIELALLKTHYYGGIRKYQWTVMPLALHGVFVKKDGTVIPVSIGEQEDEPCFVITDLLPHLSGEQNKRQLSDGIRGEELNVLIGSLPFKEDEGSELVKLNILSLLYEKYGVTEDDFLSAELEVVPAVRARDIGLDRSLIGAYGHDDRVCAYPTFQALLSCQEPAHTSLCVLADKEEIGSVGYTGLDSDFLKNTIYDLCRNQGVDATDVLRASCCLSADVNAAVDPTFQDVFEKRNASFVNYGVVITKYTGGGGKSSSNDASAEYMARIRAMLDAGNVVWQIGELGKVDVGGGGTVAKYVASLGIQTVDLGVAVLSMHAPFETVSKLDVYMTFRALQEFFH